MYNLDIAYLTNFIRHQQQNSSKTNRKQYEIKRK